MDSKSRTNEQDGDDRRQIECPEESMSLAAADGEIAADIDEKVDDGGPENDDKGEETHTPSFIFREFTKKYWHKPTLKSLQSSLRELKAFCVKKGVEELAMPRIGCGLDGLALEDVKGLLLKTFEGSKMQITMFYL
ncbi:ADP-ribose glycohydrolase oard1 [Quaeritorhiza haematococci]|nr:ADP-ribose glycohydrolase oard1 [Quaeritorhiza haematococci]